eukprot:COSAG02_NODE_1301_length_13367_cov_14.080570_14_plen_724_part_00
MLMWGHRLDAERLWAACGCGWIDDVKAHDAAGGDLNLRYSNSKDDAVKNMTGLMAGAIAGQRDLVAWLLRASGIEIDAQDDKGFTALHYAALNGQADCALLLLEGGANSQIKASDGRTPLFIAANGQEACLTLLLQVGAAVDQPLKDGTTPLFIAVQEGQEACLTLLLQAGAAVDQPLKDGSTPLQFAAQKGQEACLTLLLQAGAVVDRPNKNGSTALQFAAQEGQEACLTLLLQAGAVVDRPNKNGFTALQCAAQEGQEACVKKLLSAGADPHNVSSLGSNVIWAAAYSGNTTVAGMLLRAGADPSLRTKPDIGEYSDMTALGVAQHRGHAAIASLLRDAAEQRAPEGEPPEPEPETQPPLALPSIPRSPVSGRTLRGSKFDGAATATAAAAAAAAGAAGAAGAGGGCSGTAPRGQDIRPSTIVAVIAAIGGLTALALHGLRRIFFQVRIETADPYNATGEEIEGERTHCDACPELFGGVTFVLLASGCIAIVCGCCAYARSDATSTLDITLFFQVEILDAALDIFGFAMTWAEGDLHFSNDPDFLVWTGLGVSVILSVIMLMLERCGHKHVTTHLRLLICIHLVVEDVFQAVAYALVAGTQAQAGLGALGAWGGCLQALLFSVQKVWSLRTKPQQGGPPLARQSTAQLTKVLCTHLTTDIGITHHTSAQTYATRLVDAGYDSPAAFANISIEDLRSNYQWREGHVRQVQTFRNQHRPVYRP